MEFLRGTTKTHFWKYKEVQLMALEIFRRKEQKYLITLWQYEQLIEQIGDRVRNDKNGVNGRYTVSSLYFDNQDKDIYFETKTN